MSTCPQVPRDTYAASPRIFHVLLSLVYPRGSRPSAPQQTLFTVSRPIQEVQEVIA